jgi:riboflavin kinase/FMN adenylyltransferase
VTADGGAVKETAAAVALGFFDGVHLGHTAVVKAAAGRGLQTAVVTFLRNPKSVDGCVVPEITCRALKQEILRAMSVNTIVYLDFAKVRDMGPERFIDMLCALFKIGYIGSGFNYRFGRDAAAGVRELERICALREIEVATLAPVCVNDLPISSTRIRALVTDGNLRGAARLLGRPFALYGEVVRGRRLGRTLGTPTINQCLPIPQLLPRFGVYSAIAHLNGRLLPAVTNVGVKPTISDTGDPVAETYIIGFEGDLYGKTVQVDLMEFLRPEIRFRSLDELKAQMKKDTQKARALIGKL